MKTFLGIGAGPGMGFATAERFAGEGFQVVLAARNASNTRELAGRLKSKGYKAETETVNASDPEGVARLIAHVEKRAWRDRRAALQRRCVAKGDPRRAAPRYLR